MNVKRQVEEHLLKMVNKVTAEKPQNAVFDLGNKTELHARMVLITVLDADSGIIEDKVLFSLRLYSDDTKNTFARAVLYLNADKRDNIGFEGLLRLLNKDMGKCLEQMRKEYDLDYDRVAEQAGRAAFVLFD